MSPSYTQLVPILVYNCGSVLISNDTLFSSLLNPLLCLVSSRSGYSHASMELGLHPDFCEAALCPCLLLKVFYK